MFFEAFNAINPLSKNSGITYVFANGYSCQNQEIIDLTVPENIKIHWAKKLSFIQAIGATYDILLGDHYDFKLQGGKKGILDFLILPLVSRKLLDFCGKQSGFLSHLIIFFVVLPFVFLPIESARFTAAFLLTLALIPITGFINAIKNCFQNDVAENKTPQNVPFRIYHI